MKFKAHYLLMASALFLANCSDNIQETIPEEQWVDKRVVWDPRVNLLTSQGPGTAIDFGLKIIDLLVGREKAYEVASSLVMAAGIYNFYEA